MGPAHRALAVVVASTAIILLAPRLGAESSPADEVALARGSAAAVEGRVVQLSAAWDADTIYTYVTLDVSSAWGLAGTPDRVVLKQLGGVLADTALRIHDQAQFTLGEDVFVLLDVRPRDRTLTVAGLASGKWTRGTRWPDDVEGLGALVGRTSDATSAVLDGARPAARPADRAALGFSLLTPDTPARWHEADDGLPVYIDAQTGGHPLFPGGGIAQIVAAAARWSSAGGVQLQPGVFRAARCFVNSDPADSRISVTFGDPCGEIADASPLVAIGGAYYSATDVRSVNGVDHWTITKAMVVTDNALAKFAGWSTGCWDDLMTHELGHALGLGHATDPTAVMYPSLTNDCVTRTVGRPLGRDDRDGLTALYPRGPAPFDPPGSPVGLSATVAGSTVTLDWRAPVVGSAARTYHLVAGSLPGGSDIGVAAVTGTTFTARDVRTGVYYVRVFAANEIGVGAASNELMLVVGAGLPGAPSGVLAVGGSGGYVLVRWHPPASVPAPTGYRLHARHVATGREYTIPVTGTAFSSHAAPSGTYALRVVAVNAAGAGPTSPETALVVP